MKYLRFSRLKIGAFASSGDAQLQVHLLDDDGRLYKWVPRWNDVLSLLEGASNTEVANDMRSSPEWIERFGDAVHGVLENAGRAVASARKVTGELRAIEDGMLVVDHWRVSGQDTLHRVGEVRVRPAFAIDQDWLGRFLSERVQVMIVNDFVVDIRGWYPFDEPPF